MAYKRPVVSIRSEGIVITYPDNKEESCPPHQLQQKLAQIQNPIILHPAKQPLAEHSFLGLKPSAPNPWQLSSGNNTHTIKGLTKMIPFQFNPQKNLRQSP
jgi:hypothetical protein